MTKQHMVALLAGMVSVTCLHAQQEGSLPVSTTVKHSKKAVRIQYGVASFYANKFHGRKTANGEIFSQKKFTAASNTLPLNTWVKVTNLGNKKSVIVKVTDRMHHLNKRLIDLSKAAAHQLGYTGMGLTRVKVEVLGKRRPPGTEMAKS